MKNTVKKLTAALLTALLAVSGAALELQEPENGGEAAFAVAQNAFAAESVLPLPAIDAEKGLLVAYLDYENGVEATYLDTTLAPKGIAYSLDVAGAHKITADPAGEGSSYAWKSNADTGTRLLRIWFSGKAGVGKAISVLGKYTATGRLTADNAARLGTPAVFWQGRQIDENGADKGSKMNYSAAVADAKPAADLEWKSFASSAVLAPTDTDFLRLGFNMPVASGTGETWAYLDDFAFYVYPEDGAIFVSDNNGGEMAMLRSGNSDSVTFPTAAQARSLGVSVPDTLIGWTSDGSTIHQPGETVSLAALSTASSTADRLFHPVTASLVDAEKGYLVLQMNWDTASEDPTVPTYVNTGFLPGVSVDLENGTNKTIEVADALSGAGKALRWASYDASGGNRMLVIYFNKAKTAGSGIAEMGKYTLTANIGMNDVSAYASGSAILQYINSSNGGAGSYRSLVTPTANNTMYANAVEQTVDASGAKFMLRTKINTAVKKTLTQEQALASYSYIDDLCLYLFPADGAVFKANKETSADFVLLRSGTADSVTFPTAEEAAAAGLALGEFDKWTADGVTFYAPGETAALTPLGDTVSTASRTFYPVLSLAPESYADEAHPITYTTKVISGNSTGGIRFIAGVTLDQYAAADEYGFIITRESLLGENALTFDSGVRYVSGKCFERTGGEVTLDKQAFIDDETVGFAGFVYGIPEANANENIVAAPYLKKGSATFYGAPRKASVNSLK